MDAFFVAVIFSEAAALVKRQGRVPVVICLDHNSTDPGLSRQIEKVLDNGSTNSASTKIASNGHANDPADLFCAIQKQAPSSNYCASHLGDDKEVSFEVVASIDIVQVGIQVRVQRREMLAEPGEDQTSGRRLVAYREKPDAKRHLATIADFGRKAACEPGRLWPD